ncbi:hypothetical protein HAHE_42120 [Haloferula helveola]|uniref:Uncharacterized protein n=1 Tax=Haloferula helveola TaxID=490095 RepID=A0ABN6HDB3_9BACT|nr:hypothetical protein HAHE_42120 [Haloferula helveola]
MSEESKPPSSQPRRHRPRLTELSRETTEEDLWNLDDEPAPIASTPVEPREAEATPEPEEDPTPVLRRPHKPERELIPKPEPKPAPESPAEVPPAAAEVEPEPEEEPDEPEAATKSASLLDDLPPPNRKEWIGLGALAAVFLALAVWWIVGQFSDVPTKRIGSDQPDLPIEGNYAEVTDAETYWRQPVRTGDNPDITRPEVSFIPAISIRLSGGSGVLRVWYKNDSGEFVGDSVTRRFEGGRFVKNGSDTLEFASTDGFETNGEFNGYRVGEGRWTAEVLEGPSLNARGSEFKTLFTAPISSNRH